MVTNEKGGAPSEAEAQFDPFAGPAIAATAPSTEPQREIWTAAHMGDDASRAYNESVSLRLAGQADLDALRAAFAELVERHEALRTTFSGDGLTLCISGAAEGESSVLDWSNLDPQERATKWSALLAREVETPFDLERGPLVRARFVLIGPDELRLTLTAHHIVCDGWSTAVLVKDWAALYNARRAGKAPELPPADAFSAYARGEAEEGQGAERAADESYWLKQFGGDVPVLELPSDRPRPPLKTYASRRYDGLLDEELVRDLKRVGAKSKASLFTTLLGGFKALVSRLSGQEDLVIGIPAAGQSVGGHESLVGHCVNMLPLRSRPSPKQPFTELLSAVRTTMLDAYDHQQYTFGTLLKKLPLPRDPSRLPLVSVIFNVDRGMTNESIGFEGVETTLSTNPRHFENFDIFLNAVELRGKIELECQYNTDLFDEATIRRWLESYELLLRGVVRDPSTEIGRLPIVTEAQQKLVQRWNDATTAPYPSDLCVHQLIERQVERTPDAVACAFEGKTITYGELNRRANQVARKLRALGAARGKLVGLCVERSIDMLAGLVAIHKAGAAYVPLDPGYPAERLSFMVQDSQMPVILTEAKTRAELALPAEHVVCIDTDADAIAREADDNLPPDDRSATPESVAYVIYTSGSTGKPKGVLVPHRAAVNLLTSVERTPGMGPSDVVLAITTLSFDIAVSEVVLPLTVGAKIVLVSRDVASDGARLLEVVQAAKVTFIDATPATYRLLLGAGWGGDPGLKVICTGEAMPKDLAIELVSRAGEVWNGYGPTETTVWSTFYRVQQPITRILIGRPVANTQIHVLDARLQPVPIGVPGELYIAGDGVTHGYLNRPDLTTERFVPDPFAGAPDRRMYKTGDVGRYLPTGDLECLGRNDNQVKLRGYRIELGEIDDALGQHPAVRQAAVIVREDRPGDARLVGYAVLHPAMTPTDAELRAHLKKTLPDYMVPAAFVRLDVMPLTPSGKIDRKALPVPEASPGASDEEFVAPRTATETLLSDLWKAALNVPRVSVHDDFFALGGHSLLASQILSRLRRDHGIDLSFRKIFEAPTIARLAEVVDQQKPIPKGSGAESIPRRAEEGPAPLSLSQERLWLLEEMDPSQRLVHSLPAGWRLEGPVDVAILQRGLDEIARRHATLRTTIQMRDNDAVQVVAPAISLPIGQVDLRDRPEEEREPAMMAMIAGWTAEPFDLATGPLFRSHLVRLGDDRYVYFTLRHNIIWDGWSFDIFLRELGALYGAFAKGEKSPLPDLPIAYTDYVAWHRQWVDGPELARQAAWWREQLQGDLPDLQLPADHPRPAKTEHRGANEALHLPRALAESLTALAHGSGATLFMVLFAAFNVMLRRYAGGDDILVGTPVRARNRPEVEDLIGPFINAVVLRTKFDREQTFSELLKRVRDTTLDSFSHQDLPLELLGSRPPMVRAFFSLQDARTRPPALGPIAVKQLHVEPPAAANDMMLWMMETREHLLAMINYSTELFEAKSIQRFLRGFGTLLQAIAVDPERKISELPVAAAGDLENLERWSIPAGEPAHGSFIHRLFQARAAETPDAVALVIGERDISCRELHERARRVASRLSTLAAGPSPLVAICLEPSFEFVAAVLATLMLGGAFVPLDPEHPAARNEAILRHTRPDVLIRPEGRAELDGLVAHGLSIDAAEGAAPAGNLTADPVAPLGAAPACVFCRIARDGEPHVSAVSHASLVEGCRALAAEWGLATGSAVLVAASPSADIGVLAMMLPLLSGATGILVRGEDAPGASLASLLESRQVDCMIAAPAVFGRMHAEGFRGRSGMRAVVTGEPDAELCARLIAGSQRVFRLHAYREAALLPFTCRIEEPEQVRRIGRTMFPARAFVLDRARGSCPPGAVGHLYIGGLGVGLVPPPRSDAALHGAEAVMSSRRLAATGDRARFCNDGAIELLGRHDDHVELLGYGFDLGEITAALEKHPSLLAAVVRIRELSPGDARLVGYVVPRAGASYTETELRRHLRSLLPEVMVPPTFVELEALPQTGSGTIDVGRLPSPFSAGTREEFVPPRTEMERVLAELWREALATDRVGIYDNFFDLGGHSLLCFKVIGRIEQRTGQRIGPRIMLLNSLEQIAAQLSEATAGVPVAAGVSAPAPSPGKPEAPLASRFLQKLKGIVRGS